jgi:hypothetical protein
MTEPIEFDESFYDTADCIWQHNAAARQSHKTALDLASWMMAETHGMSPGTTRWATLGFVVSIDRGVNPSAHAAVEGWFAKAIGPARSMTSAEQRK